MFYCSILFAILSAATANASLPSLSIQTAVNEALDKNPDVLTAREALRSSEATFSFAVTKLLPTVSGTVEADHKKDAANAAAPLFGGNAYNQYTAKLNLVQPIYDGAVYAGYGYSSKDKDIKQYQLDIAERTTTESVIESFYQVLLQEHLLQILKDTYQVDKETLTIAERYFRIGRAQKLDVLQLKTQVALLPPQIAQTDYQMRVAAAQLATLLREVDASHIHLRGSLENPDSKWVQEAAAKKIPELPEVLSAHEQVDQFHDSRKLTMAAYWPTLNLTGQLGRQSYKKSDLFDSNASAWDVALVLSIPIFNGLGSIYQDKALAAQERQYELAETKTTDSVSVNQFQTEKDLEVAAAELASSQEAASYGQQSRVEAEKQFRLQTINYLQYQSSQQAYLTAETSYFNAKYNYIIAVAKYFNAAGIPIANLIAKLDALGTN